MRNKKKKKERKEKRGSVPITLKLSRVFETNVAVESSITQPECIYL